MFRVIRLLHLKSLTIAVSLLAGSSSAAYPIEQPSGSIEFQNQQPVFWEQTKSEDIDYYRNYYEYLPSPTSLFWLTPDLMLLIGFSLFHKYSAVGSSLITFGSALQTSSNTVTHILSPALYVALYLELINDFYIYLGHLSAPSKAKLYPISFLNAPLSAMIIEEEIEIQGEITKVTTLRITSLLNDANVDYHDEDMAVAERLARTLKQKNLFLDITLGYQLFNDTADFDITTKVDNESTPLLQEWPYQHNTLSVSVTSMSIDGEQPKQPRESAEFDITKEFSFIENVLIHNHKDAFPPPYTSLLSDAVLGHLYHWLENTTHWQNLVSSYPSASKNTVLPGPDMSTVSQTELHKDPDTGCLSFALENSAFLLPKDLSLPEQSSQCLVIQSENSHENISKPMLFLDPFWSNTWLFADKISKRITRSLPLLLSHWYLQKKILSFMAPPADVEPPHINAGLIQPVDTSIYVSQSVPSGLNEDESPITSLILRENSFDQTPALTGAFQLTPASSTDSRQGVWLILEHLSPVQRLSDYQWSLEQNKILNPIFLFLIFERGRTVFDLVLSKKPFDLALVPTGIFQPTPVEPVEPAALLPSYSASESKYSISTAATASEPTIYALPKYHEIYIEGDRAPSSTTGQRQELEPEPIEDRFANFTPPKRTSELSPAASYIHNSLKRNSHEEWSVALKKPLTRLFRAWVFGGLRPDLQWYKNEVPHKKIQGKKKNIDEVKQATKELLARVTLDESSPESMLALMDRVSLSKNVYKEFSMNIIMPLAAKDSEINEQLGITSYEDFNLKESGLHPVAAWMTETIHSLRKTEYITYLKLLDDLERETIKKHPESGITHLLDSKEPIWNITKSEYGTGVFSLYRYHGFKFMLRSVLPWITDSNLTTSRYSKQFCQETGDNYETLELGLMVVDSLDAASSKLLMEHDNTIKPLEFLLPPGVSTLVSKELDVLNKIQKKVRHIKKLPFFEIQTRFFQDQELKKNPFLSSYLVKRVAKENPEFFMSLLLEYQNSNFKDWTVDDIATSYQGFKAYFEEGNGQSLLARLFDEDGKDFFPDIDFSIFKEENSNDRLQQFLGNNYVSLSSTKIMEVCNIGNAPLDDASIQLLRILSLTHNIVAAASHEIANRASSDDSNEQTTMIQNALKNLAYAGQQLLMRIVPQFRENTGRNYFPVVLWQDEPGKSNLLFNSDQFSLIGGSPVPYRTTLNDLSLPELPVVKPDSTP